MRGLDEHAQTRFFAFFAVSLSATLGVAFAGNLFTLYLFYEMLLALATWPLVTHHQDQEARTGGRTYLTYLLGTSIGFVLPAMIYSIGNPAGTWISRPAASWRDGWTARGAGVARLSSSASRRRA